MDLSEIEKFETPAKVTTMSQAIRMGARARPQCFGVAFDGVGSCAIGAAYEAFYGQPWTGDLMSFPVGTFPRKCFGVPANIMGEILGRNDGRQTREQIADWLESIGY